eukprot:496585_1
MSADPTWHKFCPAPFFTKIFAINKDEFIAASKTSILIFNQQKNEWNKILDYKGQFDDHLAYDETNQTLYLCDTEGKLLTFDVKSRKLSLLMQIPHMFPSQLIFAENKLYKIDNHILYVYDDIMKQFNIINEQRKLMFHNDFPIIYLKSQKCLLSFGSGIQNQRNNSVYNFTDSLHQFSFSDAKWTALNVKMPKTLIAFGTVKCKNERHIIQFSGRDTGADSDFTDDIFIFDTRAHSFTKSKIRCPRKEEYYGTMTSDIKRNETLCFAFVNDCYKGKRFGNMQLLPFYLIQFVNEYICYEELHLFSRLSQEHWKINVDDIFDSN